MVRRALRLPLGPRALQHGEALASPYFLVKFEKNKLPHHRFAAIVGVRAGKTAVARHVIKREFLSVASKWQKPKEYGHDFLFIASPKLGAIARNKLRSLLRSELSTITHKLIPHLST